MAVRTQKEKAKAGAPKKAPAKAKAKTAAKKPQVIRKFRLPFATRHGKSKAGLTWKGKNVQVHLVDGLAVLPTTKARQEKFIPMLLANGFVDESFIEGKPQLPPETHLTAWRYTMCHPDYPVVSDANIGINVVQSGEIVLKKYKLESGVIRVETFEEYKALKDAGFIEAGKVPIEEKSETES